MSRSGETDEHSVVCRICTELSPPEATANLFEVRAAGVLSLADKVAMVGDIPMREDEDEGLPVWCCFQCQLDVEMAYRVRVRCRESDRKLRTKMLERAVKTEPVEASEQMEVEESTMGSPEKVKEELPNKQTSDGVCAKEIEVVCKLEVEDPKLSEAQESDDEDLVEQQESGVFEEVPCLKSRCCGCHQFFDTREEMLEHAEREHAVGDPPKGNKNMKLCDVCFRLVERRTLPKHKEPLRTMFRCKDCGELFITAKQVGSHHHMNHYPYRTCCSCNIKFDTVEALREHSDLVHLTNKPPADKDRPFVCNVCYLACKSYGHLYQHRTRKGFKRFQCSQCERSFRGATDLMRHEDGHRNPNAFRCPICPKTSRSQDALRQHIASHRAPTDQFKCVPCSKVYKSKASLNQHNVSRHGAQGSFLCQFCPASFAREILLNGHRVRFHMAELQNARKNIDQAESTEDDIFAGFDDSVTSDPSLDVDEEVVEESPVDRPSQEAVVAVKALVQEGAKKPAAVNLSAAKTKSLDVVEESPDVRPSSSMDDDEEVVEESQEAVVAVKALVQEGAKKPAAVNPSAAKKRRAKASVQEDSSDDDSGKKPAVQTKASVKEIPKLTAVKIKGVWSCSLCKRGFTRKNHATRHIDSVHLHATTAQFKCQDCSLSFVRKDELARHALTHSDSKKFVCQICGAGYQQRHPFLCHGAKCKPSV